MAMTSLIFLCSSQAVSRKLVPVEKEANAHGAVAEAGTEIAHTSQS